MSELKQAKCEACRADAPRVSDDELAQLMHQIPDWTPVVRDGILQLEREFKFKNFKLAWAFHQKVAQLAEDEGHHPALLLEWGKLMSPGGRTRLKACIKTTLSALLKQMHC